PLPKEERDPDLRPGVTFHLKLFGPNSCADLLAITTDTKQSSVSLFPAAVAAVAPPPRPMAMGLVPPPPVPKVPVQLLASREVTPELEISAVTIYVTRKETDSTIKGITLDVVTPKYYLDVGILIAFASNFRQVSTARIPGAQDQFIRETTTIRPAGAIGAIYYPAGQYSQTRFTGFHGLAIQAAIGADFSRINDEFYFGLLWEPIPGAGIGCGAALLEKQRLQPDYPSGALVQPNDVPKDTYMGFSPYFGVSFNTRVFQTLLDLGGSVRVPK
ncbi:MAG TPA: hypothetical protein VIV60_22900, partial [Polyangiaceae bacterium]